MRATKSQESKKIANPLLTSSYDYGLPERLIATEPANPRDSSKLLVYSREKESVEHTTFRHIEDFLPKDCAIIFNDTKVFKARIYGKKESGGKIELLLHKAVSPKNFQVQIRGKVKIGDWLHFDKMLSAKILQLNEDGSRVVTFYQDDTNLEFTELIKILESIGHVPLPPYIKREEKISDTQNYQSVFATKCGAVAAPTASLHFTDELFEKVTQQHKHAFVTLHVGAGTFLGVESENIESHNMHSEYYELSKEAEQIIKSDTKILAVGTTSTRTIEYFYRTKTTSGECDLFLHPNNPPKRVNYLLTNFHLPKSTLIMLVSSFIGIEKTLEIYDEAIKNSYRFYSYGDAMLIV